MAAKKKVAKRGSPKSKPPQLHEVIERLHDALSMLTVASKALMDDDGGHECTVLRLGVLQIDAIVDDLEGIDMHRKK